MSTDRRQRAVSEGVAARTKRLDGVIVKKTINQKKEFGLGDGGVAVGALKTLCKNGWMKRMI